MPQKDLSTKYASPITIAVITLILGTIGLALWFIRPIGFPYIQIFLIFISVLFFYLSYLKGKSPKFQGQEFRDNSYLLEGESEIERFGGLYMTREFFIEGKNFSDIDLIVTDKRIIILGSNFYTAYGKNLDSPLSVFYKIEDYKKWKTFSSLYMTRIEVWESKTRFGAKSNFYPTFYFILNAPEIFEIVSRYYKA